MMICIKIHSSFHEIIAGTETTAHFHTGHFMPGDTGLFFCTPSQASQNRRYWVKHTDDELSCLIVK